MPSQHLDLSQGVDVEREVDQKVFRPATPPTITGCPNYVLVARPDLGVSGFVQTMSYSPDHTGGDSTGSAGAGGTQMRPIALVRILPHPAAFLRSAIRPQ
jgi:hypothetical protein